MACRYICFDWDARPESEWVPMGLRDARCLLRSSNPQKWTQELARLGIRVDEANLFCLHNLTATWETCPLFAERGATESDVAGAPARNEFGYPLQL
jgi:hypothetical protein